MAKHMRVENLGSIIEVGCGDGAISTEIALRKPQGAKYTVVDISDNMCHIAHQRLSQLSELSLQPLGLLNYESKIKISEPPNEKFLETKNIENLNVKISKCSGEDLTSVADSNSYDAYFSSMALAHATNPNKVLEEALRVLRPGGKAVVSICGEIGDDPFRQIMSDARNHAGLHNHVHQHSIHDIAKAEVAIRLFEEAGFVNVKTWTVFLPFKPMSDEELVDYFKIAFGGIHSHSKEEKEALIAKLVDFAFNAFRKEENERKGLLGMNARCVWAEKSNSS